MMIEVHPDMRVRFSDLKDGCFSQLKVVKHGGVVSIQVHQVLMAALLCDAAVTHEDHVITVHQILITETGQCFWKLNGGFIELSLDRA